MNTRFRMLLMVFAGAIVFVIAVGWYALHNPDRYIPKITAYLHQKSGLQVQMRHIEIHLFPTMLVRIYDLEIKNPKPFPAGDFLNVPRLDAVVANIPLLRGQIAIQSLVLYKPVIDIISDPDGLWNYESPGGLKTAPAHIPMGLISSLQIKNGVLQGSNLIDPADKPGPVFLEIGNFSAQLNQFHSLQPNGSVAPAPIAGNLVADTARFGSIHTKDLHAQLRITSNQLNLKNFVATTYRGQASGDFSLNFGGKNTTFETNLQVNGIGMPYLLAEFQRGAPQMSGTIQAELNLAGDITHTPSPLSGVHGSGHVTIKNGELPNLNGDKNMIELERFRNPGTGALPASAFSTFEGDMELRDNRIYSKRIAVNFYGTDVVGSGSTSVLDGAMDYQGVAIVLQKQGFVTSLFARIFKEAREKNGRLTFPLRVTGTLAHPVCSVVE